MNDHSRPDLDKELEGLKDFQRKTVDYVHARFWDEKDPTRRFLVADEVGLGKTLVARGVIAKAIDHLWDTVDRIDVVYICSNSQIAKQNLARLRVGADEDMSHADRLTMLAKEIHKLKGKKLNFVSFTPGTSFNVGSGGGQSGERVLLYWLLWKSRGREIRTERWLRFFQGGSGIDGFERQLKNFDMHELTDEIAKEFAEAIRDANGPGGKPLENELFDCVNEFKRRQRSWIPSTELSRRRYRLIGSLRKLLARAAVKALEPDIVILDEFQRFKDLMNGKDEGSELAHELFNHDQARLLLLSATPYKMYTLPDEQEGDDHYKDFIDTVRFLADDARAMTVEADLSTLRSSLYAGEIDQARQAKNNVETELRRVMTRTERLASTPDRDGMISEGSWDGVKLSANDVRDFRRLAGASKVLGGLDPLEFWRSSPYVLELMDGYKLKKSLIDHDSGDKSLLAALASAEGGMRWSEIDAYKELDPGNAKMRGLSKDVLDRGAWKLAWIPPSLPYYELAGAYAGPDLAKFTKRLIFSSWNVVPKAIGTVISYEAERRLRDLSPELLSASSRAYGGTRQTGLLSFQKTAGRLTGMPVLGMLYPSVVLAQIGDPLAVARELDVALPLCRDQLESHVASRISDVLDELPPGPSDGIVDEAWYWASGILLDKKAGHLENSNVSDLGFSFTFEVGDPTQTRFNDHVQEADAIEAEHLGPRPSDLVKVLTGLAIAGPGVASLRALSRVVGGYTMLSDFDIRDAASAIAWSVRNLFNRPEMMALVRGQTTSNEVYWQDVLAHCVDGALQSVLDEYAHVLNEALGVSTKTPVDKALRIAEEIDGALSLRTSVNMFNELDMSSGHLELPSHRMRTHFAVRFGRGATEDEKSGQREGQVRIAYNSPFWPFVLASTSVGQEGLDFHQYSHAIVHWNLPSNPVDLEQREGRVHRYKGHAVRKNVAAVYGSRPELLVGDDPWEAAFNLAAQDRPAGESEVFPYWIFPLADGAHIERYVPTLPLSKETHKYKRLMRTVGAYRLVVGQPRQEDLLKYLGDRIGDLADLRIDLSP